MSYFSSIVSLLSIALIWVDTHALVKGSVTLKIIITLVLFLLHISFQHFLPLCGRCGLARDHSISFSGGFASPHILLPCHPRACCCHRSRAMTAQVLTGGSPSLPRLLCCPTGGPSPSPTTGGTWELPESFLISLFSSLHMG